MRPRSVEHHGTRPGVRIARLAVAAVWAHQGIWAKLLGGDPRQRTILAAVPGIGPGRATPALLAVGVAETALAGWILTGRAARTTAAAQTAAVLAMNAAGLRWGGPSIPHPRRLLARNACFLTLAWLAAPDGRR